MQQLAFEILIIILNPPNNGYILKYPYTIEFKIVCFHEYKPKFVIVCMIWVIISSQIIIAFVILSAIAIT